MLVVEWLDGVSEGYSDLLPSWWFEVGGDNSSLTHDVLGPKGGAYGVARCSLSVRGNIADMDYAGDHKDGNEAKFSLGTMRLIFTDPSRKSVREVQWRDAEHDAKFEVCATESYDLTALAGLTPFDPANQEDGRKQIERMVTLRQGQRSFRNALMNAYERRCAVTGCAVDDILEAAHISPYLGKHTNHVTNGLILRADIHTLFDRGLIKVGSDYRITARSDIEATYDLPEFITVPEAVTSRPDKKALENKANLL